MVAPATRRPSPRSAKSASRGLWTAVMASLTAMTLVFVALMVVELSHFADSTAPTVTVATSEGPAPTQRVTLSAEQIEDDTTPAVTVRLRNDSMSSVTVTATLEGGSSDQSGTMTAALTAQGAVVRSGSLDALGVSDVLLDASSTTPLTIDFDLDPAQIPDIWAGGSDLVLVISAN